MKILLIESYFSGSHRQWAEGYKRHSRHRIDILQLKGQFWKWRMHGGAVSLAKTYLEKRSDPDLILTTDMLDLTTFLALTRNRTAGIPVAVYFHENQLTYPWSPTDRDIVKKRDKHYGFINYVSALAADSVIFNSDFHRTSFLGELPGLLKHFPDYRDMENIGRIEAKSSVLHLGLDFSIFNNRQPLPDVKSGKIKPPVLLWNSRWEYDKNPEDFFAAIRALIKRDLEFQLVLLGENFRKRPDIFDRAKGEFGSRILQFGFVESSDEYAGWLQASDILPVTSNQDFFGISILEAVYCGCVPLLPRRLSYSELFPPHTFPQFYYENFDDLVDKLGGLIQDFRSGKATIMREYLNRFSWEQKAPEYDDFLVSLLG